MSPSNKKAHGKVKKPESTPLYTTNIPSPLDTPSAAPATRVAFREFIEIANLESIKQFLTTASSSPDSQNLKLLWARAFKEGYIVRQSSCTDTLEEKVDEARNHGYEQGTRRAARRGSTFFRPGSMKDGVMSKETG